VRAELIPSCGGPSPGWGIRYTSALACIRIRIQ
jgi:hypothetical protein